MLVINCHNCFNVSQVHYDTAIDASLSLRYIMIQSQTDIQLVTIQS